ncbi:MAG: YegS/Rv2252/BmrU family lipid kinase [Ruminococcaceae bacterium]|nr:YegS/Rv2252/BmrU family lipid kinase [Oscillospiraceae bacterium]
MGAMRKKHHGSDQIIMKKLLFLMNPNAGQRKVNKFLPEIIALFNSHGYEVTTFMTTGPGSGSEIVAQRANDYELIVCAGGDGTLNETISGVLRAGSDCPIGYIPCGSTNDFAATLKLSTDVMKAAKEIMEGEPREYDVGKWGDRYFSYIASFGAFTRVSYTTPQNLKNALGHLAYVLSGIQELPQIRNIPMTLELDGEIVEGKYLFGAVSNSTSVGGVLTLNPKLVDLSDGKFEVMLVRMVKDPNELAECVQALQNQTYDCASITFRSVSRLTVRQSPDVAWTLDGERADGSETIEIENLHRAFRLVQRQENV